MTNRFQVRIGKTVVSPAKKISLSAGFEDNGARGPVAQLARARHSHCRGQGFESPRVHQSRKKPPIHGGFICATVNLGGLESEARKPLTWLSSEESRAPAGRGESPRVHALSEESRPRRRAGESHSTRRKSRIRRDVSHASGPPFFAPSFFAPFGATKDETELRMARHARSEEYLS